MTREEIINQVCKNDSTLLSFPERGPWGSSGYRGNCSGWIHAYLIWKYNVSKMAELFAGSGTGYDVAKDMGIKYVGADLNPTPVREGILNVNAITDEVPEEFMDADFMFMHPPYSNVCKISWAGLEYPDPTGELSRNDLGKMAWEPFMKNINEIVMKYYSSLMNGGTMGVLVGDVRRNGQFHSMAAEIVKPGLEQIIIKAQHNTNSQIAATNYSNRNFVPLAHETLFIFKKKVPYMINFQNVSKYTMDIRDSIKATWRDVVACVLSETKRPMTLNEIYAKIQNFKKCAGNPHWKEKVRQVLQTCKLFTNVSRGVWQFAN